MDDGEAFRVDLSMILMALVLVLLHALSVEEPRGFDSFARGVL